MRYVLAPFKCVLEKFWIWAGGFNIGGFIKAGKGFIGVYFNNLNSSQRPGSLGLCYTRPGQLRSGFLLGTWTWPNEGSVPGGRGFTWEAESLDGELYSLFEDFGSKTPIPGMDFGSGFLKDRVYLQCIQIWLAVLSKVQRLWAMILEVQVLAGFRFWALCLHVVSGKP